MNVALSHRDVEDAVQLLDMVKSPSWELNISADALYLSVDDLIQGFGHIGNDLRWTSKSNAYFIAL